MVGWWEFQINAWFHGQEELIAKGQSGCCIEHRALALPPFFFLQIEIQTDGSHVALASCSLSTDIWRSGRVSPGHGRRSVQRRGLSFHRRLLSRVPGCDVWYVPPPPVLGGEGADQAG